MLTTEFPSIAAQHQDALVLSAYVSVPADASDPAAHARLTLRNGIAAASETLTTASHVERTRFDACAMRLIAALGDTLAQLRGHTWVGFAVADGTCYNAAVVGVLPLHAPSVVAWDTGLRVAPYYALDAFAGASLALVDDEHAALFRLEGDEVDEIARFETKSTAGDGARVRNAKARHRARVITALSLQNGAQRIFLGGAIDTTRRIAAELPRVSSAHAVVVTTVTPRSSAPQIVDAVRTLDRQARDAEALATVDDTLAAVYRLRDGVAGTDHVTTALAQMAVLRLVISTAMLELNSEGVERLVRAALLQRARVCIVHGAAAERLNSVAGGVAATLRFPLVDRASCALQSAM